MVPLFEWYLSLSQGCIPTVLILRFPNLGPAMSVLRRWPMSSSIQRGCRLLQWLIRSPSSPPCRNTSLSTKLALTPPRGTHQWPMGDLTGCAALLFSLPPTRYLPLLSLIGHHQGFWGPFGTVVVPPSQMGLHRGLGHHIFTPNLGMTTRGASAPHSHIISDLGICGRTDTESYRFVVPHCGCTQEMHHSCQVGGRLECNNHFGLWKPYHTFWVCLSQTHA